MHNKNKKKKNHGSVAQITKQRKKQNPNSLDFAHPKGPAAINAPFGPPPNFFDVATFNQFRSVYSLRL